MNESQFASLYQIAGPGHRTFGSRIPTGTVESSVRCTLSMGGKDRNNIDPWINMRPHPCLFLFYFETDDSRLVWECQHKFSSLYNYLPFATCIDQWDVAVQLICSVLHIHQHGFTLSADGSRPVVKRSSTGLLRRLTSVASLDADDDEDTLFDDILCSTHDDNRPWIKISKAHTLYPISANRRKGDLRMLVRMLSSLGCDDLAQSGRHCAGGFSSSIEELHLYALRAYQMTHVQQVAHPFQDQGVLAYWAAHWYNLRGIGSWHRGNHAEAQGFFGTACAKLPECAEAQINRILTDTSSNELEKLRQIQLLPSSPLGDAITMTFLCKLRMWRDGIYFALCAKSKYDRIKMLDLFGDKKPSRKTQVMPSSVDEFNGVNSDNSCHERVLSQSLRTFSTTKDQVHLDYIDQMADYIKQLWQSFSLYFLVAPHFAQKEVRGSPRKTYFKSKQAIKELDDHAMAEHRVFGHTAGFLWRLMEHLSPPYSGASISPFFTAYPGVDIKSAHGASPSNGNAGFMIDLIPPSFALLRLSQEQLDKLEPSKEPSVRKDGYSEFVNIMRVTGTGVFVHLTSDKQVADAWVVQTESMVPVASCATLVTAVKDGIEVYMSFTDGCVQKFLLADGARFIFRQMDSKHKYRPVVRVDKRQFFENTSAMDPNTFQFLSLLHSQASDCLVCYIKVKNPASRTHALQVRWASSSLTILHTASVPEKNPGRRASFSERRSSFGRQRRDSAAVPEETAQAGQSSLVPKDMRRESTRAMRRRSSFGVGFLQSRKTGEALVNDENLINAFPLLRNDEALCCYAQMVQWVECPMRVPRKLIPHGLPAELSNVKFTVQLPTDGPRAVRWAVSEDGLACVCLLADLQTIYVLDTVAGHLVQECRIPCPCRTVSAQMCGTLHPPLPSTDHQATLIFGTNAVLCAFVHDTVHFFHLSMPTSDEGFHFRSVAPRVRTRDPRVSDAGSRRISFGSFGSSDEPSDEETTQAPLRAKQETTTFRTSKAWISGNFGELNSSSRFCARHPDAAGAQNIRLLQDRHVWQQANSARQKSKPAWPSHALAKSATPFDSAPLPRGATDFLVLLPLTPFVRTDGWEATCAAVTGRMVFTLIDITSSCRTARLKAQVSAREQHSRTSVSVPDGDGMGDHSPGFDWPADSDADANSDVDEDPHWTSVMLCEERAAYLQPFVACREMQRSPHTIQKALCAYDTCVSSISEDVRSLASWISLAQSGQLERRDALKDYISRAQVLAALSQRTCALMALLGIVAHTRVYTSLVRPLAEKLYSSPFGPCFTSLRLHGIPHSDDCVALLSSFLDHRQRNTAHCAGYSTIGGDTGCGTPVSAMAPSMNGELRSLAMRGPIGPSIVYGDKSAMHWRAPAEVYLSGAPLRRHAPIASVSCTDAVDVVLLMMYEGTAELWKKTEEDYWRWDKVLAWDAHNDAPYVFDGDANCATSRGPLGALAPIGGQLCITAGREVKLWDTADGQHCGTLEWASEEPAQFLFYSENCTVVCVVTKHGVYVWRGWELCLMSSAHVLTMCAQVNSPGAQGSADVVNRFRGKPAMTSKSMLTAAAMSRSGEYIVLCIRQSHVVVFAYDPDEPTSELYSRFLCVCCTKETGGTLPVVHHVAVTSTGVLLVQGNSTLHLWHIPTTGANLSSSMQAPHYVTLARATPNLLPRRSPLPSMLGPPRHTMTLLSPIQDLQTPMASPIPSPTGSKRSAARNILHTLALTPRPESATDDEDAELTVQRSTIPRIQFTGPAGNPVQEPMPRGSPMPMSLRVQVHTPEGTRSLRAAPTTPCAQTRTPEESTPHLSLRPASSLWQGDSVRATPRSPVPVCRSPALYQGSDADVGDPNKISQEDAAQPGRSPTGSARPRVAQLATDADSSPDGTPVHGDGDTLGSSDESIPDFESQDGATRTTKNPNLQAKLLSKAMNKEVLLEHVDLQIRWHMQDWHGHWAVDDENAYVVTNNVDTRTASLYVLPPIKERTQSRDANAPRAYAQSRDAQLERLLPVYVAQSAQSAAWMWSDVAGMAQCTPAPHSSLCAFASVNSQLVVALGGDVHVFHVHTDWNLALTAFRADLFGSERVVGVTLGRTASIRDRKSVRTTLTETTPSRESLTRRNGTDNDESPMALTKSRTFAVARMKTAKPYSSIEDVGGRRSSGLAPKRVSFEDGPPGQPRASATIESGHMSNMAHASLLTISTEFSTSTDDATCALPLTKPVRGYKLCGDQESLESSDQADEFEFECVGVVISREKIPEKCASPEVVEVKEEKPAPQRVVRRLTTLCLPSEMARKPITIQRSRAVLLEEEVPPIRHRRSSGRSNHSCISRRSTAEDSSARTKEKMRRMSTMPVGLESVQGRVRPALLRQPTVVGNDLTKSLNRKPRALREIAEEASPEPLSIWESILGLDHSILVIGAPGAENVHKSRSPRKKRHVAPIAAETFSAVLQPISLSAMSMSASPRQGETVSEEVDCKMSVLPSRKPDLVRIKKLACPVNAAVKRDKSMVLHYLSQALVPVVPRNPLP